MAGGAGRRTSRAPDDPRILLRKLEKGPNGAAGQPHEGVTAIQGGLGVEIAHLPSSSRDAITLREEVHLLLRKRRRVKVDGGEYVLRGSRFENFGDWAFRVEFRRRS